MKRGRSTGKPTKSEVARIVAAKEGPCMACVVRFGSPEASWVVWGCDYHHTKSGNIRRGHAAGFALCPWHHRQVPPDGWTTTQCRGWYGVSLMDGGKLFRDAYGNDDSLIELQTQTIDDRKEAETMHFMEFGDEV